MAMPRLNGTEPIRTEEQEAERQKQLSISYKTVHTFGGIVGRPLYLKDGRGQPTSNRSAVTIQFDEPSLYLRVARQLSHILFDTDPDARDAFLYAYTKRAAQYAEKGGIVVDPVLLAEKLRSLVNILEVYRVTSLWGLLYPGNYLHMRLLDIVDAQQILERGEDENLLGYFLLLSLGIEVEDENLDRFRPYLVEALKKVEKRGFDATLLISKWLITKLVNELIRESKGEDPPDDQSMGENEAEQFLSMMLGLGNDAENEKGVDGEDGEDSEGGDEGDKGGEARKGEGTPDGDEGEGGDNEGTGEGQDSPGDGSDQERPWEAPSVSADLQTRAQALEDLLDRLGGVPKELDKKLDSVKPDDYTPDWKRAKSRGLAGSITNANINKEDLVQAVLDNSKRETEHVVDKALCALQKTPKLDRDEWLKKDARAAVQFTDVPKATRVPPLAPEDKTTVKRLRATFMRVLGRRKLTQQDTGVEADIPAYIQRKITRAPVDCFSHETKGMGFEALVLVDLSSSMHGEKADQVERAARIITRALRFPFCQVRIWGFSAPLGGRVHLFRYDKSELDPRITPHVKGSTPMHVALKLAVRQLQDSAQDRHLILLTDGQPFFQNAAGSKYGQEQLKGYVADTVKKARAKGVHVTTMLVGARDIWGKGQKLTYEISIEDMRKMFGPAKLWKRVRPETLGRDLIQMVSNSFVSYLRKR